MGSVTLDQAETIVDGALAHAKTAGARPITVVVLDAGGHLVALKRQDDSGILRPEIATGKAYGALGLGLGSRALSGKNPTFLAAVSAASGGLMVPVPGGVLIRSSGAVIGAVGISGDTSGVDEAAAIAGIEVAGLTADPGEE